MNKIEVINDNEILIDVEEGIHVYTDNDLMTVDIEEIHEEPIIIKNNTYKHVCFNVKSYAKASLYEIKENNVDYLNYKYNVEENGNIIINKFNNLGMTNEDVFINLNGYKAEATFNLSVISEIEQSYNINVNHNHQKTISNINNHVVTIDDGNVNIIVNGTVKKGMKDSVLNQDNKVMTMGNGKSVVKPNLFIDEDMVEARHGASIGRFSETEVFYLETRGVPTDICYQLLLKGFLLGNLEYNEKISNDLEKTINNLRR